MNDSIETDLIRHSKDFEYSGEVNRSAGQQAKFQLLMSMLEQDVLARSKIAQQSTPTKAPKSELNLYPVTPLSTNSLQWSLLNRSKQITESNPADGALWRAMHPHPLSIYNDAKRIPEHILYNCGFHTQQRANSRQHLEFKVDETLLFDVLEEANA